METYLANFTCWYVSL